MFGLLIFIAVMGGLCYGVWKLSQIHLYYLARRASRRLDKFWGIETQDPEDRVWNGSRDFEEAKRFAHELETWPVLTKREINQIKQALKKKKN